MKLLRHCLGGLLALGFFMVPTSSEAANVRLGLGADYWTGDVGSAVFDFTLGVEGQLVGPITLGARFGALIVTEGDTFGIPADLVLRASVTQSVYVEGLVGPYIFFEGDTFRAHGAFGFGLQSKSLSFGLEVGYLDPEPIIGLKLGWKFR